MAIFHYSMKGVSRAQGRSATAAIAYRAAEKIVDHRTGEVYDYTRRSGVLHTELVLPNNDTADREQFWNTVEMAEKRKDAKVARELVIGLPHELPFNEQKDLIMGYAEELSKRYGWGVDVAIHAPGKEGDHRNTHAHLLCTTRNVVRNPETNELEMDKKSRMWDVAQTSCELVRAERKRWEHLVNHSLERAGHETRVDYRSYELQQSPLLPQVHLGVNASQLERQGIPTERGDYNREVQQHNAQVIALSHMKDLQWEARQEIEAQLRQEALIKVCEEMPFKDLQKKVAELTPDSVDTLISKDSGVQDAMGKRDKLAIEVAGYGKLEKDTDWWIRKEATEMGQWREEQPLLSWLHDKQVVQAEALSIMEKSLEGLNERKAQNHQDRLDRSMRYSDACDDLVLKRDKARPAAEKEHERQVSQYKPVREVYDRRLEKERVLELERKQREVEKQREKEKERFQERARERDRDRDGGMER